MKSKFVIIIGILLVVILVLLVSIDSYLYPLSLTSLHDLRSDPNRYTQRLVRTRGILGEAFLGDIRTLKLSDGKYEVLVYWSHESREEADMLGKWVEIIGVFVPPYTIKVKELHII